MRILLARWEWQCCGTPFEVGDVVTLSVERDGPAEALVDELGAEVASAIDLVESHHAEEPLDDTRDGVEAVWAVTVRIQDRRRPRSPGFGAPTSATMPAEGEQWPERVMDLGGGVSARSRPTRWMIESTIVPGSATLAPAGGVGRDAEEQPDDDRSDVAWHEPPEVAERLVVDGWVVDLRPEER